MSQLKPSTGFGDVQIFMTIVTICAAYISMYKKYMTETWKINLILYLSIDAGKCTLLNWSTMLH